MTASVILAYAFVKARASQDIGIRADDVYSRSCSRRRRSSPHRRSFPTRMIEKVTVAIQCRARFTSSSRNRPQE